VIRWINSNLSTLALAFILAVFVWFVAAQETNPVTEQPFPERIPISMINQPAGVVLTNDPATTVEVFVYGPMQTLDSLKLSNFRAVVDLADVPLGGSNVAVNISVDHPLVSIVDQDLSSVYVRLEQFKQQVFAVTPVVVGSPALGHVVGTPVVDPPEVLLEGPASLVDPIETAQVRISVEGARENVHETMVVQLRDSLGRQISGFPAESLQVGVTVPITKSDEYAELFVTVNLTGTIASGYRLADYTADPQRVTIYGAPEVVSTLPGFVSTFPIDVTDASSDLIQRVGLMVPEGVTLIGARDVIVEIDIEPVVTTLTFPWKPIILGPDAGLSATLSVEAFNVSMIGPLALIDSFNPETDLSLTVNLYGMSTGAHEVVPTAHSNIVGVEVESILPATALVEIYPAPTATPTPTGTVTPVGTPASSPLATPTVTSTPTPRPTRRP
jgi:YbbR domain-containing protein